MKLKLKPIYVYRGEDITLSVLELITDVCSIISERDKIPFDEAMLKFYQSDIPKILKNTETLLWTESPYFIAETFYGQEL